MPSISFKAEGHAELKNWITQAGTMLTKIENEVMQQLVNETVQYMQAKSPVDKGYMRANISGHVTGKGNAIITSSAYYSGFVNFGCLFSQDTRILTKRGWVDYRNLRVNEDYVFTHKQRWRKIIDKFSYQIDTVKTLSYTILTENNEKLRVTPNHPFYTYRDREEKWINAENLVIGDTILTVHNDLPKWHWRNFKEHPPSYGTAKYIIKNCSHCNKEFKYKLKRLKFHKSDKLFYCSFECLYKGRRGKNHPNYGKKHPGLNLGIKRPYLVGANNPMFNKNRKYYYSEIGFREDLNHKTKSTWEANYCRILNHLGIQYEYEPESFDLHDTINNNQKLVIGTYTPDIKLLDTGDYIEIKGYMNKRSRNKISKFKSQYPDKNLILIQEDDYIQLEKEYSNKIPQWEYGGASIEGTNLKIIPVKIKKIKIARSNTSTVYNFSVEEDESYVANHIITHNTRFMSAQPFFSDGIDYINDRIRRIMEDQVLASMRR